LAVEIDIDSFDTAVFRVSTAHIFGDLRPKNFGAQIAISLQEA